LIKSGLCVALSWLASSAGAQEPLQWKASSANPASNPAAVSNAPNSPRGGQSVTLSQPTPLNDAAPTPARSFRVMPGAPPATVRAQQADEKFFQIEPLLQPGDTRAPQQLPKDKGFVPPPPTPITSGSSVENFGDGCGCDNVCCAPRVSGLRGWGGWGAGDPGDRYQAWASAEYLMWWQKGQTTPPLIVASAGGAPSLGSAVVLYNQTPTYTEGGGRFGIGTWLPCFCNNLGIEVNYFFLARQSSTAVFNSTGDPSLLRPFNSVGGPGFTNTNGPAGEIFAQTGTFAATGSATVHDFTQLWGIDANLRYKLLRGPNCWVDALFGYRYINLSEGIDITEDRFNTNPLLNGLHTRELDSFGTANHFNGVQLGLDGECRLWDRWFVGMSAKIAMGTTNEVVNINGSTTFTNDPFGNGTQPGALLTSPTNIGTWQQNRFAVAPEVGFKIGYDVTDHLRLFAGYNFLYLSSVVRPAEQIDVNVNPAFRPASGTTPGFGNSENAFNAGPRVPTVLLRTNDYWAQGLTFGLMYRY